MLTIHEEHKVFRICVPLVSQRGIVNRKEGGREKYLNMCSVFFILSQLQCETRAKNAVQSHKKWDTWSPWWDVIKGDLNGLTLDCLSRNKEAPASTRGGYSITHPLGSDRHLLFFCVLTPEVSSVHMDGSSSSVCSSGALNGGPPGICKGGFLLGHIFKQPPFFILFCGTTTK